MMTVNAFDRHIELLGESFASCKKLGFLGSVIRVFRKDVTPSNVVNQNGIRTNCKVMTALNS